MDIKSPLPGCIVQVCVKQGDTVMHGQPLVVLEAMKMEYQLRSPLNGIVSQISAVPGQQIVPGDILLMVE